MKRHNAIADLVERPAPLGERDPAIGGSIPV
jgi:hypothetical protein